MGFAENLIKMRKSRGWTQMDVSVKTGINPKTLSSYENGRTEPNLGEVVKLCKVFDCSISYLTGTKEREPGDITIEDIMFKLATLDMSKLNQIQDHINALIRNQMEIERMTAERKKIEMEKSELEQKLAEYDRILEMMNVPGIRRE